MENKIIWLAGLFEGEGTTGLFKYRRKNGRWRIMTYFSICNNDPLIINEVYLILKELEISTYILQRERPSDKDWNLNYQVNCKNMKGVYKVLETIKPYVVGGKNAIIEMTMRFIENRNFGNTHQKGVLGTLSYSEEDFRLVDKVKELNQRGLKKKKSEPPETLRRALLQQIAKRQLNEEDEDKVQTSMRIGEKLPPLQTYKEDT